jgi:hypothetical protein
MQLVVVRLMLGYAERMQKQLCLFLLLLHSATPLSAECYKWVDEQGVVHYADRPQEGAETVKVPESTTKKTNPVAPEDGPMGGGTASTDGTYEFFAIAEPENGETIRSDENVVKITFFVQPPLQKGHKILLYLNGQQVPGEMELTRVAISGLECGSNTIHAVVRDDKGKQLATTKTVLFYLRKEVVY